MLDEESSRLTTFCSKHRLVAGAGSAGFRTASMSLQPRMHAALSGLKGIECIADDILIAGADATEADAVGDHNGNLRARLDRCRER